MLAYLKLYRYRYRSPHALERPALVALDVHQHLFATYTLLDHQTNASHVKNKNWPFVCRDSDEPGGVCCL